MNCSYIYITFILILFTACNKVDNNSLEYRIKQIIDGIVADVPEQTISLNVESAVILEPFRVLIGDSLNAKGEFLSGTQNAIYYKDKLFVLDSRKNEIFVFDESQNLKRTASRHGRGPADLSNPVDFAIHNDTIFVVEQGNLRVQLLDLNFESITLFENFPTGFSNKFIEVFDHSIFLIDYNRVNEHALYIYDRFTFEKSDSLMPVIIESFEQPIALNNIEFGANVNGTIATAYRGLPHIFVYDKERNLQSFITFVNHDDFDRRDDASLYSNILINNSQINVKVAAVLIDEHDNVLFSTGGNSIHVLHKYNNYSTVLNVELGGLEKEAHLLPTFFWLNGYLGVSNSLFGTSNIYIYDIYDLMHLANRRRSGN